VGVKSSSPQKHRPVRLAVFASGSGTNAENLYRYFHQRPDAEVVALYVDRPRAGVIARMQPYGLPIRCFNARQLQDHTVLSWLQEDRIDFIALAGFLRKIPPAMIQAFPERIINIHPALLPRWGGKGMYGMRVHRVVIEAGDPESGITIHYVNEEYDRGAVIFQAALKVRPGETPESLAERIHQLEYRFYPQVIENLLQLLI